MGNRNTNCRIVKARKIYECDCCNCNIYMGESYLRLNIKNGGIFHFCNDCKDNEEFIETKINNPDIDYEQFEAFMEEAICWNNCNEQSGY